MKITPRTLSIVVSLAVLWGAGLLDSDTVHAQESSLYAFTWHEPAEQASNLVHGIGWPTVSWRLEYGRGYNRGIEIQQYPEGMRGLFPNQAANYISSSGFSSPGFNYNDRTIATHFTEDINEEARSTIQVEPMPYAIGAWQRLVLHLGDPETEILYGRGREQGDSSDYQLLQLTQSVSPGDTVLHIRDDETNEPAIITASIGDRVLSDYQGLWLKHAEGEIKERWEDALQGFVDAGGTADWLYIDAEVGVSATEAIKHDPRWSDPAYGIDGQSFEDVLSARGFTIDDVIQAGGDTPARREWTAHISGRVIADALNRALFEPAQYHFPEIQGSNYEFTGITEDEMEWARNHDGWLQYKPYIFGTHGSHPYYAAIRGLSSKRLADYYSYENHQHAAVRYMAQYARANYRSTDGRVQPWITYPGLNDAMFNVSVNDTPYYEEYLYHVALYTDKGTPMLYWNARDGGGGGASFEDDVVVDDVISDINTRTGGFYETQTIDPIAWDTKIIKTAVEADGQWYWRVTIERVDPRDDRPITVEVFDGGTKIDDVVVPGGEVGFWYTSSIGADLTFEFEHPFVPNLLPSDDYIDLTSDVWTQLNLSYPAVAVEGPEPGTTAYRTTQGAITEFSVPEGDKFYTLGFIGRRDQGNSNVRVEDPVSDDILGRSFFTPGVDFDVWGQHRIVFRAPEHGEIRIRSATSRGSRHSIYQPMLNEGRKHAPFVLPSDGPAEEPPTGSSQTISVDEGWNLVGSSIIPEQPALEDILGDAANNITLVKDVDGNLFFPELGLNDIGSWDVGQAYYILAHAPASFTITGTPVDPEASVAVEPGWNLVPYHGAGTVPMDEAFSAGGEAVVMARATGDKVYYPAEAVTSLSHAEPGRGYLVYVTESGLLRLSSGP